MRRTHLSRLGLVSCLGLAVFAVGCATTKESHTTQTSVDYQGQVTPTAHAAQASPVMSPQDAWQRLRAGNARFVDGRMEHPNQSHARRAEVARGQHPYAVVLACSDSRLTPEILFDCGLGDIFVIRVAGNTADDAAIGSMEYAVEHLHVPLILVLGHERCGAVQAAVQAVEKNETAPGHLPAIIDPILPAVTAAKGQVGDTVANAVRENVMRVVGQIRTSKPILAEAIQERHLAVLGATYGLDSGQVRAVEQLRAQIVPVGH
jgi:carbonic anhydrase